MKWEEIWSWLPHLRNVICLQHFAWFYLNLCEGVGQQGSLPLPRCVMNKDGALEVGLSHTPAVTQLQRPLQKWSWGYSPCPRQFWAIWDRRWPVALAGCTPATWEDTQDLCQRLVRSEIFWVHSIKQGRLPDLCCVTWHHACKIWLIHLGRVLIQTSWADIKVSNFSTVCVFMYAFACIDPVQKKHNYILCRVLMGDYLITDCWSLVLSLPGFCGV